MDMPQTELNHTAMNTQIGESKELFASADGEGKWETGPSTMSYISDGSLLIQFK